MDCPNWLLLRSNKKTIIGVYHKHCIEKEMPFRKSFSSQISKLSHTLSSKKKLKIHQSNGEIMRNELNMR